LLDLHSNGNDAFIGTTAWFSAVLNAAELLPVAMFTMKSG